MGTGLALTPPAGPGPWTEWANISQIRLQTQNSGSDQDELESERPPRVSSPASHHPRTTGASCQVVIGRASSAPRVCVWFKATAAFLSIF